MHSLVQALGQTIAVKAATACVRLHLLLQSGSGASVPCLDCRRACACLRRDWGGGCAQPSS